MVDYFTSYFDSLERDTFEDFLQNAIIDEESKVIVGECYKPTNCRYYYVLDSKIPEYKRKKAINILFDCATYRYPLKDRLTRSAFYEWKLPSIEFGMMCPFTDKKHRGRQLTRNKIKNFIPDYAVIPAKRDNHGSRKLLIPKQIQDIFGFNNNPPECWLLGTYGVHTDVLFFFPCKHPGKNWDISINALDGLLYVNEEIRCSAADIHIWYEPIITTNDRGQLYLIIPGLFLREYPSDTIILEEDVSFEAPVFGLSFDPHGNLMYERICYASKDIHDTNIYRDCLHTSDIPLYLTRDEIEPFSFEDTAPYKDLMALIEDEEDAQSNP